MSNREDFEEAASRLGYRLKMEDTFSGEYMDVEANTAWHLWQEATCAAAREQGGGEVVVVGDIFDVDGDHFINMDDETLENLPVGPKLYTHPPQSQGVPEGYVLAPKSMCITQEDVGLIVMMTGWDDEDQDDAEGVLWFGLIEDDEGNRTHGLNISCSECMEEGAIQLVQFDEPNSTPAAPQADEWVKCVDRLPTEDDGKMVWSYDAKRKSLELVSWARVHSLHKNDYITHWKPTGLTRPQPPEQGDGV